MRNIFKNLKVSWLVGVLVLASFFGLAGGLVGSLLSRVYLWQDFYQLPFFGQIDFNGRQNQGIIIRDAKKVIVEQNTKVGQTINDVISSLVGIYKKQKVSQSDTFDINNYYQLDKFSGQGLILTSDGWIVTAFQPETLTTGQNLKQPPLAEYVIITADKKIYSVDKIVKDKLTSFVFLHVAAKDFPVKIFTEEPEIKAGNLVLAVNFLGQSWLTSMVGLTKKSNSLINSSDNFSTILKLAEPAGEEFKDAMLFNLNAEVFGLIDSQSQARPIGQLTGAIKSLLKYKEVKRASLGINYLELDDLVNPENQTGSALTKGAVIYKDKIANLPAVAKGSAAEAAGLKEGDLIISIDNLILDKTNNLTNIIQSHLAGDEIKIICQRAGQTKEVLVKLKELK